MIGHTVKIRCFPFGEITKKLKKHFLCYQFQKCQPEPNDRNKNAFDTLTSAICAISKYISNYKENIFYCKIKKKCIFILKKTDTVDLTHSYFN